LEKAAQKKEALISYRMSARGVSESEKVGDMYLSSIKAKLALLDQLSPN